MQSRPKTWLAKKDSCLRRGCNGVVVESEEHGLKAFCSDECLEKFLKKVERNKKREAQTANA